MKKVALITGASKGLGLETARQLGTLGFTVLVSARSQDKAEAGAKALQAEKIDAVAVVLEVSNAQDEDNLRAFIEKEYGKLDVLVNNAAIQIDFDTFEPGNSTETLPTQALRDTFNTNFFGVVSLTQKLLPLLKKADAARIVNVSSIMGSLALHSNPNHFIYTIKPFAYDATKTALNQFTVHLAAALAMQNSKIKVNSAHPGWVKTDLGGEMAPLSVEDGVKTIVDLCVLDADGASGGYFHLGKTIPW